MENGWQELGILAAFFGVLISVGFWLLEIRNEELVNCGRHALDQIEKLTMLTIRKDDEERNYLDKSLGPVSKVIKKILGRKLFRGLLRHRVWLRLIFAFIGIAFVGAGIRGPMGSSLSILLAGYIFFYKKQNTLSQPRRKASRISPSTA